MADKVKCGIDECPILFVPGKGGVLTPVPRCSMHYQRERRKSKRATEPGKLINVEEPKTERITVWLNPTKLRKVQRAAAREFRPVGVWVEALIDSRLKSIIDVLGEHARRKAARKRAVLP